MPMQLLNDGLSQTYSVQQDFYPATPNGESTYEEQGVEPYDNLYLTPVSDGWQTKSCDEGIDLQGLDTDMNLGQAYPSDESAPILDLRYPGPEMDGDQ
ncbi:conserved fungal protein [Diplocarpon rosae]|nr:conserved fungal protein [Diplocarpon rosae]